MHRFEAMCERAYQGAQAGQRLEHVPSTHDGYARGSDRLLTENEEVSRMRARLGEVAFAILFHRVYQRDEFSQMEHLGFGDAKALGGMFLSALDALTAYYGLTPEPAAVRIMRERIGLHQARE